MRYPDKPLKAARLTHPLVFQVFQQLELNCASPSMLLSTFVVTGYTTSTLDGISQQCSGNSACCQSTCRSLIQYRGMRKRSWSASCRWQAWRRL